MHPRTEVPTGSMILREAHNPSCPSAVGEDGRRPGRRASLPCAVRARAPRRRELNILISTIPLVKVRMVSLRLFCAHNIPNKLWHRLFRGSGGGGVRVWQITSWGRGPRGGRPPPESANVDYPQFNGIANPSCTRTNVPGYVPVIRRGDIWGRRLPSSGGSMSAYLQTDGCRKI